MEDDDFANIERKIDNVFQSTSSVWRTTSAVGFQALPPVYFNPRPPCGGRLNALGHVPVGAISIHVLRVEDDQAGQVAPELVGISIHVLRVEDDTCGITYAIIKLQISIHVLRVEDDIYALRLRPRPWISIHVLRVEDDGAGNVGGV